MSPNRFTRRSLESVTRPSRIPILRLLGLVALTLFFASSSTAQTLLHHWNFNDSATLLVPSSTLPSAPASLLVTPGGADVLAGTGIFSGANAVGTDGVGSHLRINNPYTTTTLSKTVLLRVPTTAYRNVVIRYEAYRTSQGAQTQEISYTTDGTSFTSLTNVPVPTTAQIVTLDFSALPSVANNPNFAVQMTFASGTAGNNRFDNLTVHGEIIPVGPPVGLRINEVMSSNIETLLDSDEDPSDWVELVNPDVEPIHLLGYGLSDNPAQPFKWVFPDVVINGGQYLVIFASEKDRRDVSPGSQLHTNFKISDSGESIVLTAPGGGQVDQVATPPLIKDVAYGRLNSTGSDLRYFKPATPGAANGGPGFDGVLPNPTLSAAPGFYAIPVAVNATLTGTEGATLRYTLDGNEPTEMSPILTEPVTLQSRAGEPNLWAHIPTASDAVYTPPGPGKWAWSGGAGWNNGPVAETYKINTFRVRAFKSGYVPSKVTSGSYIVDPTGATRYQLPVVSIMADYNSLFSASKGLFVPYNYFRDGILWERPAHLEFFENQAARLDMDIGIRIHGSYSANARLKSLRIYARSQYGPDVITYPLFPDHPNNTHERLILRSGGSDWADVAFQDAFAQSLFKEIPTISIQYHRSAVVFINGEYWGIERFRDRYDDNFLKNQYGISDADILENEGTVKQGSNQTYLELLNYLETEDLNAAGRYDWLRARVDLENFRDYHIAQTFCMNVDQPGRNSDFWRSQTVDPANPYADGRWRWLLFDVDTSFGYHPYCPPDRNALAYNTGLNDINATTVNPKSTSPASAPNTPSATMPLRRMLSNLQFRQEFIIRFSDLLNTVFAPPFVRNRLGEFKAEIEPYMPEHIARWGYPASMTEWNTLIGRIDTFAVNRPAYMRQHLNEFFHLSGTNKVTVNVAAAGSGRVKVNTITVGEETPGIPTPAFPWSGIYFTGLPVTLRAIPEPGFLFSHWTGNVPPGAETSDSLTLNLTGDLSLTAAFVPISLPVLRHYWSFNETNALLAPQRSVGGAGITVNAVTPPPTPPLEVLASTGQNFGASNAQEGDAALTHLRINNPIGSEMIVPLPTTGGEDAMVRYETRRSGQGPAIQQIDYTTDGITYVPFHTQSIPDGTPVIVPLDFSALPATDNNPSFALRITFLQGSPAGGIAGNNRFDNLTMHLRTLPGFNAAGFPLLTATPAASVDEQASLTLNLQATDPDATPDTLSFSLVSGPSGLTVSGAGLVTWTPGETLGGSNLPVVVRVTDNSPASLSSLGRFDVMVREINSAPTLAAVANQSIDELVPFTLNLAGTDTDLPANTLIYSLVSGPEGLTVSPAGVVAWTPTEQQGPQSYPVVVQIADSGSPPLSATAAFSIAVREINSAPTLATGLDQTIDELASFTMSLAGIDADLPPNTLSYSLVSGPEGLTVSPAGVVSWTPAEQQGPSVSTVQVSVNDHGTPEMTSIGEFQITVREVPDPVVRTVWQIGVDDNPLILPYKPYAEFSAENSRNDPRPGKVTRLPGDPEYAEAANPSADDDLYFAGIYPPGFNGLQNELRVPNDEPPVAWERAHTRTDRTNRVHFVLDPIQVTPSSRLRLSFELPAGGSSIGGVTQPGFGDHDLVVRFRTASGLMTQLFSQRISQKTNVVFEFLTSAVGAAAGANTIEIDRTGPVLAGGSHWVIYDYLRIESLPLAPNTRPALAQPANLVVDELVPVSLQLSASDIDLPAQTLSYSLVSGPAGLTVSSTGTVAWTPTELQGPQTYPVVVQVADNGLPVLNATTGFSITVHEINTAPSVTTVSDQSSDELVPFTLNLAAVDTDQPPNGLNYSLVSGPEGLTVSPTGVVAWTPTELQGPQTYPVVVQVTDTGSPPLSATAGFAIAIHEINTAPAVTTIADQSSDELAPFTLNLSAVDTDRPSNGLIYSLVSGPEGLTVSPTGLVAWTPTELQGPQTYPVMIQVTDTGSPPLSVAAGFSIAIREINTAPSVTTVADQSIDELLPFSLNLTATDIDQPANTLTYALVSGPEGLTVSPTGVVSWSPTEQQGPSVNTVQVSVSDNGSPVMTGNGQFQITVREVPDVVIRTVWQIGTDDNPLVAPYTPYAEFSAENSKNDLRPGKVTRVPTDPQYVAASNPTADDDLYFSGTYPSGFNGLPATLLVPNDEPSLAWERALTMSDRTNRVHFILDPAQVAPGSKLRLTFEAVAGGSSVGGVTQPGFGNHDLVVQFRTAAEATTQLLSQRVSKKGTNVIEFLAATANALPGPNTIELIRTGPVAAGSSAWLLLDFVRIESLTGGGIGLTRYPPNSEEGSPRADQIRNGVIVLAGLDYLTLTYDRPDPAPNGDQYVVEASADLLHWSTEDVIPVAETSQEGWRTVTVRSDVPLGAQTSRFMRLRVISGSAGAPAPR